MRVSLHRDFWRVLAAALTALIVVYALRLWVIGFGLGLESFGDIWVLRLVTFWDVWALVYLGLTWLLIMRSSAQQTRQWALNQRIPPRPASFHTALGDIESIAGTVLDQPHELSVFHRLRKRGEYGASDQAGARYTRPGYYGWPPCGCYGRSGGYLGVGSTSHLVYAALRLPLLSIRRFGRRACLPKRAETQTNSTSPTSRSPSL